MVGREIELKGLPDKSLLFTWRGKVKLFELLEVKTEVQFAQRMGELQMQDQVSNELYEKMYFIGLNWKRGGPVIPEDSIPDLLEDFCQINGYGSEEVRDTLIDAFVSSGILVKAIVEAGRKARDGMSGETLNRLLEQVPKKGDDTGEVGEIST